MASLLLFDVWGFVWVAYTYGLGWAVSMKVDPRATLH